MPLHKLLPPSLEEVLEDIAQPTHMSAVGGIQRPTGGAQPKREGPHIDRRLLMSHFAKTAEIRCRSHSAAMQLLLLLSARSSRTHSLTPDWTRLPKGSRLPQMRSITTSSERTPNNVRSHTTSPTSHIPRVCQKLSDRGNTSNNYVGKKVPFCVLARRGKGGAKGPEDKGNECINTRTPT